MAQAFSAGVTLNGIMAHEDWLPTFAAAAGEVDIKDKLKQELTKWPCVS